MNGFSAVVWKWNGGRQRPDFLVQTKIDPIETGSA
jgi:hypothetical protein